MVKAQYEFYYRYTLHGTNLHIFISAISLLLSRQIGTGYANCQLYAKWLNLYRLEYKTLK